MLSPQSKIAPQPVDCAPGHPVRSCLAAGFLAGLGLIGPGLIGLGFTPPAVAVPVADLYVAQVPTDGLGAADLDAAYARALDEVLVRVTGQSALATDPVRRSAIGPAGVLVRRYQPVPGGQLRVSVDPDAVRRRLDAAGLPVWAADRPQTLVVLPAAGGVVPLPAGGAIVGDGSAVGVDPEQQQLLMVAARRGVPVVVVRLATPGSPVDADPLADPAATLQRAGADVLLVGEAAPVSGAAALRWTLVQGDGGRAEWPGDIAAGVNGLADRLAARYAGTATAQPPLHLQIQGVTSFDAYGRLQQYLRQVGVIQHLALNRMTGDTLAYEVVVRGDTRQLVDAFALQGVLEPVAPGTGAANGVDTGTADLIYRLAPPR